MNRRLTSALLAMMLAAPAFAGAGSPSEPPSQDGAHEAQDAHAAHHPQAGHEEAALPAIRWASDAPLREGMRRVRSATEALSHAAHGHLDAAQVQAIAAELESAVQDMIARCKLAPEPDAALHPLLARVLQASATLADGTFDAAALAELEAVLRRYPGLFEDGDWVGDPTIHD